MSVSVSTNSPKGSPKSLLPPQLPAVNKRGANSCALTYSVDRSLMRTASGLPMVAPLSPNVNHQSSSDSETSPAEDKPLLQLNGGRLSETVRAQMTRASMTSSDSSSSEKTRLSSVKSSRLTKTGSSAMLTIPEREVSRGSASMIVTGPVGSWAEYAATHPTSPTSPIDEEAQEQRKSALESALATILKIPECRESLRQTMAAKMNWAEWAVSPSVFSRGSASPISPFDFYQASGLERQGSYLDRTSIRAPPGLEEVDERSERSSSSADSSASWRRAPPTLSMPLMAANVDANEPESSMGRAAAVRRNPWATANGHHEDTVKKGSSMAPLVAPNSIWDRAVTLENPRLAAKVSPKLAPMAPASATVTVPTVVAPPPKAERKEKKVVMPPLPSVEAIMDYKPDFEMKVVNLSMDEENIFTKLSKKVRQPRGKGKARFTCHIFLPEEIATDKGFRAASYLIGNGGQNMKIIFEHTGAKLRVRGIGSGFKERGEFEADAPMHLCISADSKTQMDQTKKCVFPLFERLVEAYSKTKGTKPQEHAVQVMNI